MKQIALFILITFSIHGFAQKASDIFAERKEYVYEVVFIQGDGDTLTNEKMIMTGKDEEWKYQAKQTVFRIQVFPRYC